MTKKTDRYHQIHADLHRDYKEMNLQLAIEAEENGSEFAAGFYLNLAAEEERNERYHRDQIQGEGEIQRSPRPLSS